MKTMFLADVHLEAGRDLGYGDYGPGSRFDDQVAVLDRVADLAVAEECGVVCVVGDVFHRPTPAPWAILAFQDFARRLDEDKIAVIVVHGNHDVKGASLPTALDLFGGMNVAYYPRPGIWPWNETTCYACLPWTPMSTLIANEGRNEQTRERAIDLLVATTKQLRDECATKYPDATPILLAHWSVSGSSLPNGLPVDELGEPVIPWFNLDAQGWGLVALGHIHNAMYVAYQRAETRMFYCGSTAVVNMGELAVDHGVWIYDHEADDLAFHAIEDRPFLDYEIDAEQGDEGIEFGPFDSVANAVVRCRYRANGLPVDEARLRQAFTDFGAHRVFIKEIDKPQTNRARIETPTTEIISSIEAIDLYLKANQNGHKPEFIDAIKNKHHHYIEKVKKP